MNNDELEIDEWNEEELVVLPVEDVIDLHTFAAKEIKSLLTEYLYQCHERNFPLVRIIHGKGIGVQREIVRSILAKSVYVDSFADAPPDAGGWGATIAVLKY